MDLFIEKALIFNGLGSPAFEANIGIKKDRIVYIGKEKYSARETINAKGLILSPGFIDTHSHSDFTILADPVAEGKITQGITTEINGNCGVSGFPMFGEVFERRLSEINLLGLKPWNDFKHYIDLLKKAAPSINFITLCGHGNIRGCVIGYKNVKAQKKEINKMKEILKSHLAMGVKGLSTGLIYPPGIFSDTEEIIELAKTLKKFKGIYATHMRSEGEKLLSALEETVFIGMKTGVSVHISHLKTSGKENWWKIEAVFKIIEEAHSNGIKITADRYPYTASQTDLDAFLPSWIIEGSRDDIIKRLKNKNIRNQIKKYLKQRGREFLNSLLISDAAFNRTLEGRRLGEIIDFECSADFICDLLIRSNLQVGVIYFGMSEENLEKILSRPYVMIGTDSSARSSKGITRQGKPHPRGFGSFPRFIKRYVLDKKILSLEEAIRKITFLPAKTFKIEKRGAIKEGYFADIVIFDPAEIEDRATFENPFNTSKGIKYVIVNGEIAVFEGSLTGKRSGRMLL
ncbi:MULTISPECIES: N-acyl-D-amino-acid deacylase family protein [Thermodesulfovibrio]|jgi:N-acyl-D-amino-acid deacylase|uniref:D-aminoacylase n=1 Tax=Thermodesulfovibrio obliviosus TaxID=3118332 RepID=A0AAU8GZL1_9BACT